MPSAPAASKPGGASDCRKTSLKMSVTEQRGKCEGGKKPPSRSIDTVFLNFLESLKIRTAWRKDFFDTLRALRVRRFSAGLQIAARGQSVAAAEHPREGEDIRVSGLTGGLGLGHAVLEKLQRPGQAVFDQIGLGGEAGLLVEEPAEVVPAQTPDCGRFPPPGRAGSSWTSI